MGRRIAAAAGATSETVESLRDEWERQERVRSGPLAGVDSVVAVVLILGAFVLGFWLLGALFPDLPIGPR